ncbi:MAG TPA: APC family permease [Caulobacteraceae bacterium]|nr:APC family permease [Caulobacteraceae bacterium]
MTTENDIAAHEAHRDAGLTRGIGLFAFTFAIINAVVGGGIFSLPAAMAHAVGSQALIAYVVCAVATGAVVLCCAEAGSRVPTSGGMYGYAEAAFGPLAGFVGGVLYWIGAVLAAGGIAAAVGDSFSPYIPALPKDVARDVVIVVVLLGVAVINSVGVKAASRIIGLATALKLIPLLLFVGVGLFYLDPVKLHATGAVEAGGVGPAFLLAMFAFQGMETPLGASGEVANPARNLPRALFISMIAITALYIGIQVVSQGLLGGGLAASTTPLADAFARIDPRLGLLMLAAAAISRTVWLGSDSLGAPRILFAFARDGFLPSVLGMVSPRGKAPVVAIFTHAAIAITLAITGTFEQLAILSSLATVALYILAAAAAWKLARDKVALAGEPLNLKGLTIWVVISIVAMAAMIAMGKPEEIGALVGTLVVLVAIYYLMKLVRRRA